MKPLVRKTWFESAQQSHEHSLWTLNTLYAYDDFMESVQTVADMGCGIGLDLEWWATRTTRDLEHPKPLNIRCMGIDISGQLPMAHRYKNMTYLNQDFEQPIQIRKTQLDVVWCHDAFQWVIDPFRTLSQWRDVMSPGGMLAIIVPQMTNLEYNRQAFDQLNGCYWNWTLVSLIHVLAVGGWDCRGGFFYKSPEDPWIHAVVYRGDQLPRDPRRTTWYDLAEAGLLPDSAVDSVNRHGYLRQRDLLLPWLDKSLHSYAKH